MVKTMEYMAMSKPIVAFDLPENRWSAEAGFYASGNSITDLATQIARLMDDPDLRLRLGKAGRSRVENGLLWRHHKQELLAAYRQVFGLGHSSQPVAMEHDMIRETFEQQRNTSSDTVLRSSLTSNIAIKSAKLPHPQLNTISTSERTGKRFVQRTKSGRLRLDTRYNCRCRRHWQ